MFHVLRGAGVFSPSGVAAVRWNSGALALKWEEIRCVRLSLSTSLVFLSHRFVSSGAHYIAEG